MHTSIGEGLCFEATITSGRDMITQKLKENFFFLLSPVGCRFTRSHNSLRRRGRLMRVRIIANATLGTKRSARALAGGVRDHDIDRYLTMMCGSLSMIQDFPARLTVASHDAKRWI